VSRFRNLEFDEGDSLDERANSAPVTQPVSQDAEKNESHWLQLAETHRRHGHHENALRFYSRALEIERSLPSAWVGQVQMLILLKEYPQASTWAKKALELFPNHPDLLAAQSQAECRRGDLKQGNALIDGAMKIRGESAYQWQVRGELMLALKQRTDRHCFDKAQVCSKDSLVPLETALIYLHYGEFAKGQQRAATAVEKQPDSYFGWFVLGQCQEGAGLEEAAKRSYRQCCNLCPDHQESKMQLVTLDANRWTIKSILRRMFRRS